MRLRDLLDDLRAYSGVQSKRDIQRIGQWLDNDSCRPTYALGDDAAAIKTDNGYDLLAGEGFISEFVRRDPWFAGWCGVMVNISDIAAMGGRPTAVVNAVWGDDDETMEQLFNGMSAASAAFRVPIVGGHTNLQSDRANLAVSILGRARRLLSGFAAEPSHNLVCAIDLRGAYRQPFLNWNAATSAPTERLRGDLELLPTIAEASLAVAAKDISQAGVLGTCVMLLESSAVGAEIDLKKIPKPHNIHWREWLRTFPSYGYLLTSTDDNLTALLDTFASRDIAAAVIGRVTRGSTCEIIYEDQREVFWDLQRNELTGMVAKTPDQTSTKEDRKHYARNAI